MFDNHNRLPTGSFIFCVLLLYLFELIIKMPWSLSVFTVLRKLYLLCSAMH